MSTEAITRFFARYANHPHYSAPRGQTLHAHSWQTEAPLRMLLNNLDAEVAEDPANLIVYGGTGQAARDVASLRRIVTSLLHLGDEESLLIQSGKAVGVLPTHAEAPRVLIANSNLVPHWATWEQFNALKARGLIMYGQMTAGSWIYIGTQGILQGTYETFAAVAKQHFGGTLKGRLVVSGGLGGMGGAQPLASTLNGAVFLGVDIDPSRIEKRLRTRYIDCMTHDYAEAKRLILDAKASNKPLSVGLVGEIGTTLRQLIVDKVAVDVITDQTSAHDPLHGYIPSGYTVETAETLRSLNPTQYREKALRSMATHVEAMLTLRDRGAIAFEYGNNLRQFALEGGADQAFSIPGFAVAYIRSLFCQGKGPFRWVALSGEPTDIQKTDEALMKLFPEDQALAHWLECAQKHVTFQGLPARICWLGLGQRQQAGQLFNELVAKGIVKAPIVIGRDHLDTGSVASPFRETEAMLDGSDAISDWPLLNLMANGAAGATWVAFHHGGGVGIGFSQHAGMVIVADGTERASRCLSRVLHNDPALGVIRHADAGYPEALELAKKEDCYLDSRQETDNTRVLYGPFEQLITMRGLPKNGPLSDDSLELIKTGGICIQNGRIVAVGLFDDLRSSSQTTQEVESPQVALPGFIDAHTHICFAGNRAQDYTKRLNGKTYSELSQEEGGILYTVKQTRAASEERLIALMLRRLDRLKNGGITTCEVKSGYGLTLMDELKMLNAIAAVSRLQPISLIPTCLAAHARPIEYTSSSDYLNMLIKELLPLVKVGRLASRVDIFIEEGAFTVEEARRYLLAAKRLGFAICVHADQFSRGGAQLAAEIGALSADHLEQSMPEDFERLCAKEVCAILLPGASLGLGMPFPAARSMLDHGLSVAIASDWNPGSAPMGDLLTQAALLGMNQRLTHAETFAGMTVRASQALKLTDRGSLTTGLRADIVAFPCADYREILYYQGALRPSTSIIRGERFDLESI